METDAQTKTGEKDKLTVPTELFEAYIIAKTGWDVFTLRATPQHVLEELLFYWHIENMNAEWIQKKHTPKTKARR